MSHQTPSDAAPSGTRISVCICTYKRPQLLRRLLGELSRQETAGAFTFSIVVADNDRQGSAKAVVSEFQASSTIPTVYCLQPEQNIALTRNKALQNANGAFIAFIDDDEFPAKDWLARLLSTCVTYRADGILGPVRPHFDDEPPAWLRKGRFCERPEHITGSVLGSRGTRTGNVLFRRSIVDGLEEPFRRELGNGGEDEDFFRRMIEKGRKFVWCNEAVVYEVVPPQRWRRTYYLKRALLRGQNERFFLTVASVVKSLVAVPLYALLLPFMLFCGQHWFMHYSIRLFDHLGRLLSVVGIKPLGAKYLNG